MKIHLASMRVLVAVAVTAGVSEQATAQYLPYRPAPQTQPAYGYPAQQGVIPQGQVAPQQQPAYTAYRPQQQPVTQYRYPAAPAAQQQPYAGYPTPQQQQYYPTYPSVAQQNTPTAAPTTGMPQPSGQPGEVLPGPNSGMVVPSSQNGMSAVPSSGMPMDPQPAYNQGYGQGGANCNCNQSYPNTGYYGGYVGGGCNQPDYGISNYFNNDCGGNQWFGGVYWLFMNRDNPSYQRFTVQVDSNTATYPYYPPASTTVLSSVNTNNDFRSGAEIRFGSTFSIGSACDSGCNGYGGGYGNSCGCQSSCESMLYAWEVGYWFLDDKENVARTDIDILPVDNMRYYGMKNFAGIEYDRDGAGGTYSYRPVNDYYDYNMPIDTPGAPAAGDIRVVYQTVRSNFQAQNLELNFLKLPLYCSSPAPTSSCGYGNGVGNGYGNCGYGGGCGDTGYGGNCGGCDSCGPAFTVAGLCGVRYLKIDDDFSFADTFIEYDGAAWGTNDTLTYAVNADNRLVGLQLGANMNYCIHCKCNLFCDTNFGLYNNDMNVQQRVYGSGAARFVNTGNDANINTNKDDVAFLGELRVGGAYDITCHWRGVIAYRAIGVTGLALSTEQMPDNFASEAVVGHVNNDGSMIIHGVQVGAECRY